jgi:membrane associated rhomboid family serine protease
MIIPFVNIWWLWKYAAGVELVTKEKISQPVSFLLLFLLSAIGDAIIQDYFNKVDTLSTVS